MQAITKVYNNYDQAELALTSLEASGVHSPKISIVANKHNGEVHDNNGSASVTGTGAGIGAAVGGAAGLLTGLGLIAIPGVGPVVAAGWLVSTAIGALAGEAAGGIVGVLVSSGLDEEHAHVDAEAIRRGGTFVSVRAQDGQVEQVHRILDEHRPPDASELGAEYRNSGWTKFETVEGALTARQKEVGRARRSF
jgi:hypothetical protein